LHIFGEVVLIYVYNNLGNILEERGQLEEAIAVLKEGDGLKYWCEDETRIGLKTIERKKIQLWKLN